jgi:hypothetical protein
MNAITWWDHETDSMWSQPWGWGIKGTHKGVELNLLPFQLTTWGSWGQDHPDTLVMVNDTDRLSLGIRQGFRLNSLLALF